MSNIKQKIDATFNDVIKHIAQGNKGAAHTNAGILAGIAFTLSELNHDLQTHAASQLASAYALINKTWS